MLRDRKNPGLVVCSWDLILEQSPSTQRLYSLQDFLHYSDLPFPVVIEEVCLVEEQGQRPGRVEVNSKFEQGTKV